MEQTGTADPVLLSEALPPRHLPQLGRLQGMPGWNSHCLQRRSLPGFQMTLSPGLPQDPRDCSLVTLGIGGDVRAELKFKASFPKCRLVGADPHPVNGQVYASKLGGRFVPTAVGTDSGILTMSTKDADGHYRAHNVSTKEFLAFLLDDVRETLIDQLWMDNEGPEYRILEKYPIQQHSHAAKTEFTDCSRTPPTPSHYEQLFQKICRHRLRNLSLSPVSSVTFRLGSCRYSHQILI